MEKRVSSEVSSSRISRGHRNLLLVATVFTALLVTMGAVVCATESGAACPDWPGCFGRAIPPPQIHSIIEYTHRFIAALTTPLIIAAAVVGWRRARHDVLITRLPLIAIFFTLAVVVFGAFAVLTGLARGVAALDLGSALIVLTLMTTSTTAAYARRDNPALPDRLSLGTRFATLGAATGILVYGVYVGGILVAGTGSLTRCLSWPIWRVLPVDVPGWPQLGRLAVSIVALVFLLGLIITALREPVSGARRAGWVGAAAFLVEMAAGLALMTAGASPLLAIVYVAAAVLLWCMIVNLAVLAGLAAAQVESAQGVQAPSVRLE
jgi:cytochrome c oxidase assembly protein subunit 15